MFVYAVLDAYADDRGAVYRGRSRCSCTSLYGACRVNLSKNDLVHSRNVSFEHRDEDHQFALQQHSTIHRHQRNMATTRPSQM